MVKEALTALGIGEDVAEQVLALVQEETERSVAELTQERDQLKLELEAEKERYSVDTAALSEEIKAAKVTAATDKLIEGFKFSSELAKKAARAELEKQGFELSEEGILTGGEEFMKALQESNPTAFAEDAPPLMVATATKGTPARTPDGVESEFMARNPGLKI